VPFILNPVVGQRYVDIVAHHEVFPTALTPQNPKAAQQGSHKKRFDYANTPEERHRVCGRALLGPSTTSIRLRHRQVRPIAGRSKKKQGFLANRKRQVLQRRDAE
jgi:hypothetical protein